MFCSLHLPVLPPPSPLFFFLLQDPPPPGLYTLSLHDALPILDVNTGAFVGRRNLEETIFKTNMEAATAIARQLRLRNLGGIIIPDFIDMEDREHERQVLRTLEKALEKDHAKISHTGVP